MPRRRSSPAAVAVLAAALISAACAGNNGKPENAVFITLDTFRADHLSALSRGRAATPVLDALAARGILYENAWSPIPITLPAHKSIFFGRPPHLLETYNNGQIVASRRDHPSFVQAFRKKGFDTAAFVSLGVLTREFGTAEGFEHYEDRFPDERWYLTAEEVNRRVIPWLEARGQKPFFLWVHYSDPHDPYAPPGMPDDLALSLNGRKAGSFRIGDYAWNTVTLDLRAGENILAFETMNPYQPDPSKFSAWLDPLEFGPDEAMKDVFWEHTERWFIIPETGTRFLRNGAFLTLRCPTARRVTMRFRGQLYLTTTAVEDLYRKEVEYLDGKVGELLAALDRLGLRDETAVLVAGDHGEGLGEYRLESGAIHYGHINFLEKVYLHVPLIISVPGGPGKGTQRAEPVTLLDIAPTFLAMFELEGIRGLPGRNLLALPAGAGAPVFAATYRPESDRNRFALIEAPWHMILSPEQRMRKMYDMSSDPGERTDIWETAAMPRRVGLDLEKRLGDFARRALAGKKDRTLDPKTAEMLKSLGYLGN